MIRGSLEVDGSQPDQYRQRCDCERTLEPEDRWPGFDFNTWAELCRCCAITLLRSGSRWSPFFCEECKRRVMDLNRRLGDWIIPVGRHSVMHGQSLAGDEAAIREHAEHFVIHVRGLFAGIDHLDIRARACLRENLEELGFPAGQEVELKQYGHAARARPLDKAAAFEKLREHFVGPITRP